MHPCQVRRTALSPLHRAHPFSEQACLGVLGHAVSAHCGKGRLRWLCLPVHVRVYRRRFLLVDLLVWELLLARPQPEVPCPSPWLLSYPGCSGQSTPQKRLLPALSDAKVLPSVVPGDSAPVPPAILLPWPSVPSCHLLSALTLTTTLLQMVPHRSVLDILRAAPPPCLPQLNFCSVLFRPQTPQLRARLRPHAFLLGPICRQVGHRSGGKHPPFSLPFPLPNKTFSFPTWL